MENIPEYSKYIEYTNLGSMKSKDIKTFVETANVKEYAGVCLQSGSLPVANKYKSEDLKLITVAGFPPIYSFGMIKNNPKFQLSLGLYNKYEINKIHNIIDSGLADELDLVFPMYWFMSGKLVRIHKFLKGVKQRFKKPVKVIIELGTVFTQNTSLYEILDILEQANIDYLKTNTGLLPQTFDKLYENLLYLDVLMKDLNKVLPVKASGGIRTKDQIDKLVKIGIPRIGTSSIL